MEWKEGGRRSENFDPGRAPESQFPGQEGDPELGTRARTAERSRMTYR